MAVYDYFVTYGSTPTLPLSVYVLDGNFAKQTLAGITSVTLSAWPAQGLRTPQPVPGAAPIINGQTATYTNASDGTLLQYTFTHADCQNPPGAYAYKFTVSSSGGKVDIWPSAPAFGLFVIEPATS